MGEPVWVRIKGLEKILDGEWRALLSVGVTNARDERAMPLGCHLLPPGVGWFPQPRDNPRLLPPREKRGRRFHSRGGPKPISRLEACKWHLSAICAGICGKRDRPSRSPHHSCGILTSGWPEERSRSFADIPPSARSDQSSATKRWSRSPDASPCLRQRGFSPRRFGWTR